MTHHITDEQIDELCLSLTGTYTRKERDRAVARAVLALAAPAPAVPSDELRIARGAIRELEQKVFSQEQAIAVLRASVARYQRDMEDPPAYLQDAVIRAAGLGAMAEEIAALKKKLTAAPTPPAQSVVPEDVARDAKRYRWLRDMASQDWLHRNHNYQNLRGAAFDAAIDAARAAEKGGV